MWSELLTRGLRAGLGVAPPDPRWFDVPSPAGGESAYATLRYLGTAGFVLEVEGRTVVLDPFVSRRPLGATLGAPLTVDEALGARLVPRADEVLVGHAHFDHILDAPAICRRTGARFVGSRTACMVARAGGVPEAQLVETAGREDVAAGPLTVRGLPSVHAKLVLGRTPFPGDLDAPPRWPARMHELPHGPVLNWVVSAGGLRVGHIDSADFLDAELAGHEVDVLCLCAIGRALRPGYTRDAVRALRPRYVVPCHWDTMITPVDGVPDLLPGVDLPGFFREIEAAGATCLPLPLLGEAKFPRLRR